MVQESNSQTDNFKFEEGFINMKKFLVSAIVTFAVVLCIAPGTALAYTCWNETCPAPASEDGLSRDIGNNVTNGDPDDTGYSITCNYCGQEVERHTHSFGDDFTPGADATCEKAGTKTQTCGGCGYVKTVDDPTKPALGHSFVTYVYNNDATYEKDGTKTATCNNGCGKTNTITAEGTKLVKDDTNPAGSADPTDDSKATTDTKTTTTTTQTNLPQTGDATQVAICISLLLVSGSAVATIMLVNKKRKFNK
jgi:hypothetical protein